MAYDTIVPYIGGIPNSSTTDFEDRLQEHADLISKRAEDSHPVKAVRDSYGNSLLSIGTDNKVDQFNKFALDNNTLNWSLWLALYNDSWVFKRAIDKPSIDEIRCGVNIIGDEDYSKPLAFLKKYRNDFIQLIEWGALFGGSIACLMFENVKDEEYKNPIDYNKIRKAKSMRMYVADRWYGVAPSTELVDNMNDIDFGKPRYYDVTLADGNTIRFNHTYVLRYEHRTAPQLIKKGMLQGWGYAEGAHIINELVRDEKAKATIQSIMDKSTIEVIKMDGMRGVFMGADKANQDQLTKRLEMVNWGRNYNSLTFLDKNDSYERNEFHGLSGLADLLQQNMWLIASALEMQGVLFGDLKNGFSTDQTALERYAETINNRCEQFLRPIYQKFLTIAFKLFGIDGKLEFDFPMLTQTADEDKHTSSLQSIVTLLSTMLNDGVIDLKRYALAIKNYSSTGVLTLDFDDEYIDSLDDKMAQEMEGIEQPQGGQQIESQQEAPQ